MPYGLLCILLALFISIVLVVGLFRSALGKRNSQDKNDFILSLPVPSGLQDRPGALLALTLEWPATLQHSCFLFVNTLKDQTH